MGDDLVLAVDSLEGTVAVLIGDDGRQLEVQKSLLPRAGRREGAILRVRVNTDGSPLWKTALVDRAEEARRLEDARSRLDKLKKTDSGGDVSL